MVETKDGKKIEQEQKVVKLLESDVTSESPERTEGGSGVDIDKLGDDLAEALEDNKETTPQEPEVPSPSEPIVKFPPHVSERDQASYTGSAEAEAQGIRSDNMSSEVTKQDGVPLTRAINSIKKKVVDPHVMSKEAGALHDAAADDEEELDKAA